MRFEDVYEFRTKGVAVAYSEKYAHVVKIVELKNEWGTRHAICYFEDMSGVYGEHNYVRYVPLVALRDAIRFFRETHEFKIGDWFQIDDLRLKWERKFLPDLPGVVDWLEVHFGVHFDEEWAK